MEIQQFRLVVRAHDFERSQEFYGDVLALPLLHSWDGESGRGALYRAGSAFVEVRGRSRTAGNTSSDEIFSYQGAQKMSLTFRVASAEQAYEELIFRERNIPGGLKSLPDGTRVFETQDPDGVRILFLQAED